LTDISGFIRVGVVSLGSYTAFYRLHPSGSSVAEAFESNCIGRILAIII